MEHLPAYLADKSILDHAEKGLAPTANFPESQGSHEEISGMNWADIERQLIVDTLVRVNGRRSKAAEILGWGRSTLWRKMKQYGLES